MNRVKIKDNMGLERDLSSHAVINTSMTAYESRLKQIKKEENFKNEFSQMKADVAEIKELLKNLGGK